MPFSIGIRNSHDKSLRLGLTAGMRVFVCSNIAFSGEFTPVLAKHTRSFNLIDTLAVGVDRIERSFEPMRRQVEDWRQAQITDERAKLILYSWKRQGPSFRCTPVVLPTGVRRVLAADDVESFQCVYLRIQRTGPHPTIQGHSQ